MMDIDEYCGICIICAMFNRSRSPLKDRPGHPAAPQQPPAALGLFRLQRRHAGRYPNCTSRSDTSKVLVVPCFLPRATLLAQIDFKDLQHVERLTPSRIYQSHPLALSPRASLWTPYNLASPVRYIHCYYGQRTYPGSASKEVVCWSILGRI